MDGDTIFGCQLARLGKLARFANPHTGKTEELLCTPKLVDSLLALCSEDQRLSAHWTHKWIEGNEGIDSRVATWRNFRKDDGGNLVADAFLWPTPHKDAILHAALNDPQGIMVSMVFNYEGGKNDAVATGVMAGDFVGKGAMTTALLAALSSEEARADDGKWTSGGSSEKSGANTAAHNAHTASAEAHRTGSNEAHKKAADAHNSAADKFKALGSDRREFLHREIAKSHERNSSETAKLSADDSTSTSQPMDINELIAALADPKVQDAVAAIIKSHKKNIPAEAPAEAPVEDAVMEDTEAAATMEDAAGVADGDKSDDEKDKPAVLRAVLNSVRALKRQLGENQDTVSEKAAVLAEAKFTKAIGTGKFQIAAPAEKPELPFVAVLKKHLGTGVTRPLAIMRAKNDAKPGDYNQWESAGRPMPVNA